MTGKGWLSPRVAEMSAPHTGGVMHVTVRPMPRSSDRRAGYWRLPAAIDAARAGEIGSRGNRVAWTAW